MSRPTLYFVPVKTAKQQTGLMMVGVRDRLIRNRTQLPTLSVAMKRAAVMSRSKLAILFRLTTVPTARASRTFSHGQAGCDVPAPVRPVSFMVQPAAGPAILSLRIATWSNSRKSGP